MQYDKGKHTVFHHRYHIVWITKYRYKVLKGAVRARVREIARQVCEELSLSTGHSDGGEELLTIGVPRR